MYTKPHKKNEDPASPPVAMRGSRVVGVEQVVDVTVGVWTAYVAEAGRRLFHRSGIGLLAGSSEAAVIAEDISDPGPMATGLLSETEYGSSLQAIPDRERGFE